LTASGKSLERVSISRSNSKTGTASVSLPPGATCVPGIPCFNPEGCYAWKMYFGTQHPYYTVGQAWDRNLRIYKTNPDRYFREILDFLSRTGRKDPTKAYFRWHVGGDFPDLDYLLRVFELCRQTPHIKYTAYTKRYAWVTEHHQQVPQNLSIYVSGWPGVAMPEETRRLFNQFWLFDPDRPDPRIPDDAVECLGDCANCRMCWENKEVIKVHKH